MGDWFIYSYRKFTLSTSFKSNSAATEEVLEKTHDTKFLLSKRLPSLEATFLHLNDSLNSKTRV